MAMSTRSKTGTSRAAASKAAPSQPSARSMITKKRTPRAPRTGGASAAASATNKWPDLTLLCDDGQTRPLHSFLSADKPGLVLFTYPRANTGGCTAQASGLSAFVDEAGTLGYSVVGASYDSVKSQASWSAKLSLKCRLLCDTLDTGLLKKIGAHKPPKSVKRSVFIIRSGVDADPVIVEKRVVISPKDSISFVQEYVRENPCAPGTEGAAKDEGEEKDGDKKDGQAVDNDPGNDSQGKKDGAMEDAGDEGDSKPDGDKQ